MVNRSRLFSSIFLEFLIFNRTFCFTHHGRNRARQRNIGGWMTYGSMSISPLKATIYYPSDDDTAHQNVVDFHEYELESTVETHRDLTQELIFPEDRLDTLVRLAVAYGPPDQGLRLDKIDHVEVLRIDGSHIHISAVVCDQHECVTVSVPVHFPNPCCSESCDHELTTCVIDNVAFLDIQADQVLREKESSGSREEDAELSRYVLLLENNGMDSINLPHWWTDARPDSEMMDECKAARQLLNEDVFRSEVRLLAQTSLVKQRRYCQDYDVIDAGVVKVGASGLYLRTLLRKLHFLEDAETRLMDVAIPFEKQATDAHQLRTFVLEAVSSVSAYKELGP